MLTRHPGKFWEIDTPNKMRYLLRDKDVDNERGKGHGRYEDLYINYI